MNVICSSRERRIMEFLSLEMQKIEAPIASKQKESEVTFFIDQTNRVNFRFPPGLGRSRLSPLARSRLPQPGARKHHCVLWEVTRENAAGWLYELHQKDKGRFQVQENKSVVICVWMLWEGVIVLFGPEVVLGIVFGERAISCSRVHLHMLLVHVYRIWHK